VGRRLGPQHVKHTENRLDLAREPPAALLGHAVAQLSGGDDAGRNVLSAMCGTSASWRARPVWSSHVHNIKIALLGPIVPQSNPVLLAEEMAMLDTMVEGRLIVGMLRGTTNEMMTYDLNPEESRERTDEGMELILRAWKEPEPLGWQGRHFHYRTVSVWPKPLQEPLPPMYALGTSREASDFAARNQIGLGVSFGPFEAMGRVTGYHKQECARWGWQQEAQ
jgi:alkanesulfonate monooxygenase SsuD/methylene tetrahydromethanopterin reductase-like flavin-dependent oxidoreductase (luciferase family)